MRSRGIYGALTALLLAMVVMMVMLQGVLLAGISAFATDLTGDVVVLRGGKGKPIPLSESTGRVKVGDLVRTGPDGGVVLHWADGTRLEVGPDSQLEVRKYQFNSESLKQTSLIRLDFGRVWARVAHKLGTDSRFEVETEATVAGVRGTIFSLESNDAGTELQVFDGAVEIRRHDGGAELIGAGGAAVVTDASTTPLPLDEEQMAALDEHTILQPGLLLNRVLAADLRDGRVTLKGTVEPGASLIIDGAEVPVALNGRFEHPVTVDRGSNEFELLVTDAAGHQRRLVKRLVRD